MKIAQFKDWLKSNLLVLLTIPALFVGFGIGIVFDQYSRPSVDKITSVINKETNKPDGLDFNVFWDVWHQVEDKYVERQKLDYKKMIYGAINGMLGSLGDPYTIFMPPQETKDFTEEVKNGEFGGVGIEIGVRKNVITVIAPLPNTPASHAGILAGDKVLKIDNTITSNLSLDGAVQLIRGEANTEVTLTIGREGEQSPREFKLRREVIKIPIIRVDDKDGFAYVRFYQFTQNSAQEFRIMALKLLQQNPKGIILDLRNNPGGYLDVSVDLASWFLPLGKVVVTEDFGNGKKYDYKSSGYNQLSKFPLVILLNQGSASASEILAGALRDQSGIKLVGDKSFGKGSVQELEDIKGGSSLKITVAKWLTPKGISISDNGLAPDVEVKMTEENINNNVDPQLDKALEIIKGLVK